MIYIYIYTVYIYIDTPYKSQISGLGIQLVPSRVVHDAFFHASLKIPWKTGGQVPLDQRWGSRQIWTGNPKVWDERTLRTAAMGHSPWCISYWKGRFSSYVGSVNPGGYLLQNHHFWYDFFPGCTYPLIYSLVPRFWLFMILQVVAWIWKMQGGKGGKLHWYL